MEERHAEIYETIKKFGKVTIAEIAMKYSISYESARRDLRILEENGLCKRTHGGAIAQTQIGIRPPADRDFEEMPIYDNYREIARIAVARIKENDTVYLPSGSFGHVMLSVLPHGLRFTAVVNSVDMGRELRGFENINVYIAGGMMRKSGSLVDSLATEFIGRMHFDACFMTGAGLTSSFGLTNGTDETASFQRTVLGNSRRKYLLIPGQKVGSDAFIRVCSADSFDEIITDGECVDDELAAFRDKGITVTVAEASK